MSDIDSDSDSDSSSYGPVCEECGVLEYMCSDMHLRRMRLAELKEAASKCGLTIGDKLSPLMNNYVEYQTGRMTADEVVTLILERNFLDAHVKSAYEEAKRHVAKGDAGLLFAKKYAMTVYKMKGYDIALAPPGLQKLVA